MCIGDAAQRSALTAHMQVVYRLTGTRWGWQWLWSSWPQSSLLQLGRWWQYPHWRFSTLRYSCSWQSCLTSMPARDRDIPHTYLLIRFMGKDLLNTLGAVRDIQGDCSVFASHRWPQVLAVCSVLYLLVGGQHYLMRYMCAARVFVCIHKI